MSWIFLAHLTVYDAALGAERVLRFASAGFTTGTNAAYRPPGVAAHLAYEPRIMQPASMRRDCFSRGATGGASDVGYGELMLANGDGALDYILDLGFDGRPLEIVVGHLRPWQAPTWIVALSGTMEQPRISRDSVAIRLRDRQALLDVPAAPSRYGGTNELPAGLDGLPTDLAGKPVPRCWGMVFNVAPPMVNSARLIYQVNDGAVASVDAVYDRGAALTKGADYADQADMEATPPAAGNYRAWPAGGYCRLGSTPAGLITADVTQGATAAERSAAQIAAAIATGPGGIEVGDLDAADIADLDAANAAQIGLWIDGDTSCRAALDLVLGSIGAWWGFDRLGSLRMARLDLPGDAPDALLDRYNVTDWDRVPTADTGNGVPAWRATLRYRRRWVQQDSDLAGSVSDARKVELREGWQRTVTDDPAVKTAHQLAPELAWDSLLIDNAAAAAECGRRFGLYSQRRDRYEVRVRYSEEPALLAALDLGATVSWRLDRFDLEAGKPMRVLGVQDDMRHHELNLTLWG